MSQALKNYNLGRDPVFRNKVRSLLMKVATQKLSIDNLPEPALIKIYALANECIKDQEVVKFWEQVFSMVIPAWGSLTDASGDDDIYSTITDKFNSIAGVNAKDLEVV